MLMKQKEANRQSMILLQNAEPSIQLLKALEDVAVITKTLEEERLQHQQKVRQSGESASVATGSDQSAGSGFTKLNY